MAQTETNPAAEPIQNVDPAEIEKFSALASRWWDPNSEFKPLHVINPLRLAWIKSLINPADVSAALVGQRIVDVGCGGGILAEAMALSGADVTGIDLADKSLTVAKLHSLESGVRVNYRKISAEELADEQSEQYDIVACMEMLEHVPNPASVVQACADLVKPGGWLFFSTLNRNPKSYLFAIIGAEYVLKLLPKGTHQWEAFIKPSELAEACRAAGLDIVAFNGMTYNPFSKTYKLSRDASVNYMVAARKAVP
ncbi:MAG: bifunctional 2-polyprenyl-6-hydroxyphenol methylase/3-demethylubiquinol 3-O-methyltransferase UbiG [Orrella sp.]